MSENEGPTGLSEGQQYALLAVVALIAVVVGVLVAPAVSSAVADRFGDSDGEEPDNAVAVVRIEGAIVEPIGKNLEDELREIRTNDSIEAVVLEMDTPGGAPGPTERMYKAIQRTNEEMPVIASVQSLSASAGYYMMLPAEEIYVLPTSQVGSVGLNARAPQQPPLIEGPSGPDKAGGNAIQAWAQQQQLADVFIETVMEQRGDRIELSREQVAHADVYLGVKAVENGFADEIGSLDDAIFEASDRAELGEYEVVRRDITPEMPQVPLFVQTDDELVAVYDENPGYGGVERVERAMVHWPAIPEYDTLDQFIESDRQLSSGEGGDRP
jgi:protease-4